MFKLSMWWKDLITKLCVLYCVFQVVARFLQVISFFIDLKNPLIPSGLKYYASFPNFLLIPFWAIGAYLFWKFLSKQDVLAYRFWFIPSLMLAMFTLCTVITLLAFEFNPFA